MCVCVCMYIMFLRFIKTTLTIEKKKKKKKKLLIITNNINNTYDTNNSLPKYYI